MKKAIFLFLFFQCYIYTTVVAQMWNENLQDTLYGNEWIDFDHTGRYYKIKIAEDGIYKLSTPTLIATNIPVQNIEGQQYQIFRYGEQIPIHVSSGSQSLGEDDYIEFYGQKNRSEIDRHLFKNPDAEMLNPEYSLVTDTAVYFLTWTETGEGLRYETLENDLSGDLPAKEEWFMARELKNYAFVWFKNYQKISGTDIYYSHYDVAEGFATARSVDRTENITATHVHPSSSTANLSIRLATNVGNHQLQIDVNNTNYIDESFGAVQLRQYDLNVPLSTSDSDLQIDIKGVEDNNDQHVLSNIILSYQRTYNFDGQAYYTFTIPASTEEKYLEIENFNTGNQSPVLYDVSNGKRIVTTVEEDIVKILLPPSTIERTLVLTNTASAIQDINTVVPTTFVNYEDYDAEYILLSHAAFFDDGQGNNLVQAYADYRSSSEGGNYTSLVVDIEQLYDQFGYGLYGHSISVRNFAHFVNKHWESAHYFFMVGKGRENRFIRKPEQFQAAHNETFFVPTFGYPASDNLLFSDNYTSTPLFAHGRIAVTNTDQLRIYLNKVKEHDAVIHQPQTIEQIGWTKNVLHLGGGGNGSEQLSIKSALENMALEVENSKMGAKVQSYYKSNSDPVQEATSSAIFDRLNQGASLITFFGHSGAGTLDYNIDSPELHDNKGKYPLMIALGCNVGNIFTGGLGISERFCFYEDKTAIGFLGSTGFGFVHSLRSMAVRYYDLLGDEMYGQTVGDILRKTVQELDSPINSIGTQTLIEQTVLQGDPVLRLHPRPGPDYVLDYNSVRFEPSLVNLRKDSFELNFSVVNIGTNFQDSMSIEIVQELPDNSRTVVKTISIQTPTHDTTLLCRLPTLGKISVGLNRLYIQIDKENTVVELPNPDAELNNHLVSSNGDEGIPFYVVDNGATPIYPSQFGIVGTADIVLKASTSNALAPEEKYLIEIDTTNLFNSPIKEKAAIVQTGGLIKWQPNLTMVDSTVYYWRISPDSTSAEIGFAWEESSFTYLAGNSEGWRQGHYFQYLEGEYDGVVLDEESRRFEFDITDVNVRVRNKLFDAIDNPGLHYNFGHPAQSVQPWNYLESGLAVVISDPTTAFFWKNPPQNIETPFAAGDYGVSTGGSRVFAFPTNNTIERANLLEFLEDVVPDGFFVYVWSIVKTETSNIHSETWAMDTDNLGTNLFDYFEAQGAGFIRLLEERGTVPYVLMYQKGQGLVQEAIAEDIYGVVNVDDFFPRVQIEGKIQSTLIGPAANWQSLKINRHIEGIDTVAISVIGIDNTGHENTIVTNFMRTDTTLNFINATEFPYLKLEYYTKDEALSPAQLNYWQVNYQSLPDIAISSIIFPDDTIQQGAKLEVITTLENVGYAAIDSTVLKYTIIDKNNNETTYRQNIAAINNNESISFNVDIATKLLSDIQNFSLKVNENESPTESHYFNNFAIKQFFVEKDKKNPILDVTFDGRHIFNGDIIAPSSLITITLEDENEYFLLDDTTSFEIILQYPDGQIKEIDFNHPNIVFYPANSAEDNQAKIELQPQLEQDGKYTLTVQGKDITGNISGAVAYEVSFQVIHEEMISNVFNYPNPFSTTTRFVYTLTGNELPDVFRIRIMTVSGQVVREIDKMELGNLKIGTHQTDFAWDGTDEFGDKLANGIYLYQVIVKDNNNTDYEKYDNGTNKYFKKDIGKIVILR